MLLAFLRRLGSAEDVKVNIEENGQPVTPDRMQGEDAHFEGLVSQVIQDAVAGRLEPMTSEEMDEIDREMAEWGEKTAALLGITSDDDIVRLVNDVRRVTTAS